jgi:hypothetical protein
MNDQHVLTLVEAIHGANFHTIHQLTFDATLIDYIGHRASLPDGPVVSAAAYAADHTAPGGLRVRTKNSRY